MKNNIKIQTLSQVHVGSGVFLQKDNDFIVVDGPDGSDIFVIDPNKMGQIIGTDQATIDNWVSCVERGNSADFIKTRTAGHSPKEYAKRRITNFANFNNTQGTLKECIHDGLGRPYIPGSSIKGAIRTAVVSTLARQKGKDAIQKELNWIFQGPEFKRKKLLSDFEQKFMGKNPNTDLFRFIMIGDAFFDKGCEVAVKQINLNITPKKNLKDFRQQQIVEAIGGEEETSFSLKIDNSRYQQITNAHHKDMVGLPHIPEVMTDIPSLFAMINQHTKQLVEKEIQLWKEQYSNYIDQDDYVTNMENILDYVTSCNNNECVLRLGQAIGWRFITGAWTEMMDEDFFYDNIVPIARPNNWKYSEYDFPKSRRIDDESYLFGFVKMTYLDS